MRFGPYELRDTLKQRGAVITSRARDSETGARVILKMLQRDAVTHPLTEALRREFDLIRELDSPRVVSAIDLLWSDDRPAIVLQDHGGQMLQNVMETGPIDLETALRMGLSLARSLQVVHAAGIMHGDISPQNVLVGDTPDELVLIDFGLSERGGLPPRAFTGLRGSPDYIAPEMTGRLEQGADHRADLYSFGVLFYQMLAGQLPYEASELLEKVHAHLALDPKPLRDHLPTVPAALSDVVERLLRKRMDRRYQTAEGLVDDLSYCLEIVRGASPDPRFEPGGTDIPRKLAVSTQLQGRSGLLEHVRAAYEQVREGSPSALTCGIEGPAGVGKSSLVREIQPFVDRSGGLFLICNFDSGTPINQLIGCVGDLVQLLLTERYGPPELWRARFAAEISDVLPVLAERVEDLVLLTGPVEAPAPLGPREAAERLVGAIRRFLRVCGREGHPLVMVCEDVHLADTAARNVLSGLARIEGPERMLLIATRRSGERHALPDIITDMELQIEALDASDIAGIVARSFRASESGVLPLARAIHAKVGGAPLAVGQFLGALSDAGHVRFGSEEKAWVWDLPAIEAMDVSENIVELLLDRGRRFSEDQRTALGSIACIGRGFTRAEAEAATGLESSQLDQLLAQGLAMGWLAWQADGLRFTHERIFAAARDMLEPDKRFEIHRTLAFDLLSKGEPEGEALFSVATHLFAAIGPDAGPELVGQALGLNAAAGGLALGQGDLQRGHRHFDSAARLLSPDLWKADPGAGLQVTAGAAGAAVLVGAFETAEAHFETFLERCPDQTARAGIHALRILSEIGQNRTQNAIAIGVAALEELGDPIPPNPGPADIEAEVGGIFQALGSHGVEELTTWHEAEDPKAIAIQQVLAVLSFPSFSANAMMFATSAARLVARSVRDGLSEHSALGFNDFGLTACGPMNQVGLGYGFSQMAQALLTTRGLVQHEPRVLTVFNAFIRHRREPIRATLTTLRDLQHSSLAGGDLNMAALASFDLAFQHFWIGERFELAEEAFAESDTFIGDLNVGIMPDLVALYRQLIEDLGNADDPAAPLEGQYASSAALEAVYADRRDPNGLSQLYIAHMLLAQLAGDREGALAYGRKAVTVIDGITSTPAVPAFYAMFAMLAVPVEPDQDVLPEDLAIVRHGAALAAYWASEAPMNYAHYDTILRAELALLDGDESTWLDLAEEAADLATQQSFTRDAAMVLERAALVCRARGRARRYAHFIRDAWRAWIHYGAESKIASMQQDHASELDRFVTSGEEVQNQSMSLSLSDEQLDLGALLRSTRAISQEVRTGELLRALLAGVVEIAGASSALVVAPRGDEFHIVADFSLGIEGTRLADTANDETLGPCTPETVPLSALRLVTRLRRPLTTRDVTSDQRLAGDPFFDKDIPASLAVLPLTNGNRLLGLIYLENRDIPDAFAGTRLNLLTALCAQAAISWDNASLYDRQSKLLAAADRFVPSELARLFNRDSIVDVEMTDARFNRMTLMVSDLRDSTASAEQMTPQRTFARINAYLSEFSTAVQSEGGIVLKYMGDGVLAIFPEGTLAALRAATAFQSALDRLDWRPEDGQPLGAGIAIHAGEIMFGVVGDGNRMQIDALSDAVNVAFRLEALTRQFGARVLVTEEALSQLENRATLPFKCRYLGQLATQGRQTLNRVHQVIDAEPPAARAAQLKSLAGFDEAVRLMEADDRSAAVLKFAELLRENPGDVAAAALFKEAARR